MPNFMTWFQSGKTRNIIIIVVILIIGVLLFGVYWSTREIDTGVSPATVPRIPEQIEFDPGARGVSKEYLRTLLQSEKEAAEKAKQEGRSSVPTIIRGAEEADVVGRELFEEDECYRQCIECCRGREGTSTLLNKWVKEGNLSAEAAAEISKLQDQKVSVSDYANNLNRLVREGKVTPEQAKRLLDAYRREAGERVAAPGEKVSSEELLDQMVGTGAIDPKVASELRDLQREKKSVNEYARALNQMVKEGKLTPDQAKQLLDSYREEAEKMAPPVAVEKKPLVSDVLNQMVASGEVDPATAAELKDLQRGEKSVDEYAAALNRLVKEGKITPEQAKKLLASYQQERTLPELREHDAVLRQLQADDQVKPETAEMLNNLRSAGVTAAEYAEELNNLVKTGQISPETAQKLLASYRKTYGDTRVAVPDAQLAQVQRAQQERELRRQEQALREQREIVEQQKRIEQARTQKEVAAEVQKRQQALEKAMGAQAQTLFTSWNIVPQVYVGGGEEKKGKEDKESNATNSTSNNPNTAENIGSAASGSILTKAGDIMFAVLDTTVNSDQPGPVMATIVSGKFKGGKLLGSLTRTPDKQRVILKFNLLNMPEFEKTVSINAVAINPDTARTAIASEVDNHYLLRYGSLFAANFIYGYAQALQMSGTVTTDESSGDKTTENADLSTEEKAIMGLGEVGNKLNEVLSEVFDKDPTVWVDSGVGLGILFLQDVKKQ
jgi:polyhydroxyalkanoate synthesis regulator phasin